MSDRRVLAISAACITAAIFLFLLSTYPSWKTAIGNSPIWQSAAPSTPPIPEPTGDKHSEGQMPARPAVQAGDAVASTSDAKPAVEAAASTATKESMPSFDIVRVEPSGESVIAGRAKAGATVVLLDQGRPIAQAQADASGQVAFVPPTLAPGEHSLMLSLGAPATPGTLSSQSVAVSVPDRAKAPPMVALLQPDQPTRLLAGAAPAAAAPPVSVGAIDVEEMGSIFATGHATPGSQCRIYLNGSFVAGVTAGPDGTWSLKIEHGMRPGHYTVRVDELASANGAVQARAEVPFDYPARTRASVSLLRPRKGQAALPVAPVPASEAQRPAAAAQTVSVAPAAPSSVESGGRPLADASPAAATAPSPAGAMAPVPAGATTIVSQLLTTRVVHGDSLWRISRKMLGRGRRYTQIYAANTTQIRDPRLIYPGQIFVMPQAGP